MVSVRQVAVADVSVVIPPIVAPEARSLLVCPPLVSESVPSEYDAVAALAVSVVGHPFCPGMSVAVTGLPRNVCPQA